MRIALCLLTFNEIDGVRLDVPQLPRSQFDEVFAVDGGSRDGTVEFLQDSGIPVHRQSRRGLNAAYHEAFGIFTADAIVFYHPKGTISPPEVARFRGIFEAGAGLVVASRMLSGARNEEDDRLIRLRKWFVQLLSAVTSLRWRREGRYVTDILHGFRGVTRPALAKFRLQEAGTTMDLELVMQSYIHRVARTEFPVCERARTSGTTHFKAWPTGLELLGYVAKSFFRSHK